MDAAFSLQDRVFVVTGSSSGIGRAMTHFLHDAGASVIAVARRAKQLSELVNEIGGDRIRFVAADLAVRENLEQYANECLSAFTQVDGVINAAGVNLRQPVDEITLDSWDTTLNLNLAAPFFFSRFCAGYAGKTVWKNYQHCIIAVRTRVSQQPALWRIQRRSQPTHSSHVRNMVALWYYS